MTKEGFDRYVLGCSSLFVLVFQGTAGAANLEPATLKAWDEYVESAKARMEQRLSHDKPFLWVDESPERLAKVRAGEIVAAPVGPHSPVKIPAGLIHDWVGVVFIPHASTRDALAVLNDYAHYKDVFRPAVIESKPIATSANKDRFSLVLMNKAFFLKTALDTDYETRYVRVDHQRGYTVSRTTRIQEVEDYGSPAEHELREGEGRGILWRLFAVTRLLERDGGVYIEIEAIALSRDIPASLRWLVEPVVRRVSRTSLITSLQQTEDAVRSRSELNSGSIYGNGPFAETIQDLRATSPSRNSRR